MWCHSARPWWSGLCCSPQWTQAARSWLISWQVTLPFDLCTRTSPIFQLTSVMSLRIRRSFGEKEAPELCGRSRRRWCSPPGVWDTGGVREIRLQFSSKAGVRCHKATQELVPGLQICHQVSLFLTQLPVSYKSTSSVLKYRSFNLFYTYNFCYTFRYIYFSFSKFIAFAMNLSIIYISRWKKAMNLENQNNLHFGTDLV